MKEEQNKQQQPSPEKYETEMQNARRGYISGTALDGTIDAPKGAPEGATAWDITSYDFLNNLDPDTCTTIHPNLLRQEQMNNVNGLFVVCYGDDGSIFPLLGEEINSDDSKTPLLSKACILQLRSYDLATMSFVRSRSGKGYASRCPLRLLGIAPRELGNRVPLTGHRRAARVIPRPLIR